MLFSYTILASGFLIGFYMTWNIGANDVANSMASAVGAKAITLRQAIVIAGILNIVGAAFIGSHVTETIRKGILSGSVMTDPHILIIGALSALLSAALWVSFATWKSLPVSTTHSIVGSMIGFGLTIGGVSVINWKVLGAVVASWVISPILSMAIAFILFKIIVRIVLSKRDAYERAIQTSPYFIGVTMFVVVMSFVYKTPLGGKLAFSGLGATIIAFIVSALSGIIGKKLSIRMLNGKKKGGAEGIFRRIQIGTSCYIALAHGSNDVANAVGPLAMIYFLAKNGTVSSQVPVPFFLLFFGGVGIATGIAMGGARVIKTVGEKITTLNNSRGFSVDFAAATTVLLASKLGLPVSTTHAAVGGVMGVGMARGIDAVNYNIIFNIILYWLLTVPVAAGTCVFIFKILSWVL